MPLARCYIFLCYHLLYFRQETLKVHAELSRVEHAAVLDFSTDYTNSALQECCCEYLFTGHNMAVASLNLFAAVSCLIYFKSVNFFFFREIKIVLSVYVTNVLPPRLLQMVLALIYSSMVDWTQNTH